MNIQNEAFFPKVGMAAGENLDFVPHRFWHTDSVYKSYVKLYIVDIVSLLDYPMGKGNVHFEYS